MYFSVDKSPIIPYTLVKRHNVTKNALGIVATPKAATGPSESEGSGWSDSGMAKSPTSTKWRERPNPQEENMNPNLAKIDRTNEHYTFELAQGVKRTTVTFRNHFGIELAGDLYTPQEILKQVQDDKAEKFAALAISGPFGAVKEQSSGFYANQMASRGYIALAFDPSYTGESGGEPRYMNSPDINTEDFMAAAKTM